MDQIASTVATTTTTTATEIRTREVNSNLNVAHADDVESDNAKLKLDDEDSIGNLNGIQQEYSTEDVISSHGNNYYEHIDNAKIHSSTIAITTTTSA